MAMTAAQLDALSDEERAIQRTRITRAARAAVAKVKALRQPRFTLEAMLARDHEPHAGDTDQETGPPASMHPLELPG